MSIPLVLYHANCWDGFCAAWVARKALGEIEAVPVQYGQTWPEHKPAFEGREVYVLDFSFTRTQTVVMAQHATKLVVLDHHKAAEAELSKVPQGLSEFQVQNKPDIRFDMNKSGGRLAWEYFCTDPLSSWANIPVPWLVEYTEDRDLWRWALPDSRAINAWLRSWPLEFQRWDVLSTIRVGGDDWIAWIKAGESILRREQQIIDEHVSHAREIEMAGHKVKCVNATVLFSDIAGELAKDAPFGVCYFDRQDGKRQWSLRSRDDGVDVSEIAKSFGGGGHRNAAGFETFWLASCGFNPVASGER